MHQRVAITGPAEPEARLAELRADLAARLYGKQHVIDHALVCLLAGGHLLIEDAPGMGKTTLATGLARVLGLDFSRIQFTSDLLPGDILGLSVYDPARTNFVFRPGPIFHALVMADEINRANPRTQSALLEAMAEGYVSIDGATRALPRPFHVIATQNPADQGGTFALPDSQLDRFLMCLSIGYPPPEAERRLLGGDMPVGDAARPAASLDLAACQAEVARVAVTPPLIDYLLALIAASREPRDFITGLSPRAGIALRRAAQAQAWLAGRDHVRPADVQAVLGPVVDHRLTLAQATEKRAPSAVLAAQVRLD
ncbi:AAA family ATPase [Salinisphaera japonica]|nr:AAA family ATPase [Salinisphaera japonica]